MDALGLTMWCCRITDMGNLVSGDTMSDEMAVILGFVVIVIWTPILWALQAAFL